MDVESNVSISSLIHNGGVLCDVEGDTIQDVYQKVCGELKLPDYLTSEQVYNGLVTREGLLSTAVGNGIALPHSGNSLIKKVDEQEVVVVYLKKPLSMPTPDLKPVNTLFILLTMNSYYHIKILEELAHLSHNIHFITAIKNKVSEPVLSAIIKGLAE